MSDKPTSSRSTDASNRRRGTLGRVVEFPKAPVSEVGDAGLMIIFELDERRFAVDWNVNELSPKQADVIPIRKERRRKSRPRPRQV
jgi:hypothetical protein